MCDIYTVLTLLHDAHLTAMEDEAMTYLSVNPPEHVRHLHSTDLVPRCSSDSNGRQGPDIVVSKSTGTCATFTQYRPCSKMFIRQQ